ncbi:MAG: hypothetical protein GDA53_04150 [Rhodobacteraceae bacterium]|nr:hypothetical protein [Paracoccaceae bacterium]
MALHAHILTNISDRVFTRHAPNWRPEWDGVTFSFGLTLPAHMDVLIVYTRASWTVRPGLPRGRTAFVGGEPEVIHNYSGAFLNQFGLVVASTSRRLATTRLKETAPIPWFAGYNFAHPEKSLGFDALVDLPMPEKDDRISVVTSLKTHTPFQRRRLKLIEHLKQAIPERIVIYGAGVNRIADKKDALLPHRYHLALENNGAPFSWTEKLADPLLCHAFPFYVGCSNVEQELPADALLRIDPKDPAAAINVMVNAVDSGLWARRLDAIHEARNRILHHHNILALFSRITKQLCALPAEGPPVTLRSEKSLPPEPGSRGTWPGMLLRRAVLAIDPGLELRVARRRGPHQ